jgi:hypothetical protein
MGGYSGGEFGGIVPLAASPGANGAKIKDPFKLETLLKQTAALVKQNFQISPQSLFTPWELCENYPDGYTDDTLELESNGASGDIIYTNCDAGDGVIIDGTMSLSVTLVDNNTFKFKATMDPLYFDDGSLSAALYGRISGKIDELPQPVEQYTYEITVDDLTGHTYWINDYTEDLSKVNFGTEIKISGRYYDSDYGYVDLTTPVTIFILDEYNIGTYDGLIDYTGRDGSHATLSLGPNENDYCINGSNASGAFPEICNE